MKMHSNIQELLKVGLISLLMVSYEVKSSGALGPVSRKSRELFGPEKLVVKLQSACFEKLIFLHVFNTRKIKRIAKFEGLEPRRCEDIKGIVAPERDPKSFGTFEKQAPGVNQLLRCSWVTESRHLINVNAFPRSYCLRC